ncbi:MAG: YfhO family protein [Anaerolineae bacterium]|nr:YfhO family protein [Anaerolineae bacterium]
MVSHQRPSPPRRWPDIVAVSLLAVAVTGFFWKLVFTGLILPRGDVFTYFMPYWDYRNAALRDLHLPLWNPYLFMGAPFLANSQAGVLYPPNWLIAGLSTPASIKAAIVLHLVLAGVGTYLFVRRSLDFSPSAGVLAALVFALGGYVTAQVEHVNQLQGLAWLPWICWLWHEALHPRPAALILAGLALALQLLAGHTQTAFITGVGLGLWACVETLTRFRAAWKGRWQDTNLRLIAWPLGSLGLISLVALALAAAQILPTLELTSLSARGGGLTALEAVSFSLNPLLLGRSLLPSYALRPLFSEYVGYSGVVAVCLAVLGTHQLRLQPRLFGAVIILGAGLFLAAGAYNPVYWFLVNLVPGFDLFRVPARWLALAAFGLAILAGHGLDSLRNGQPPLPRHWLLAPVTVISALGGLAWAAPLARDTLARASLPTPLESALWGTALLAVLVTVMAAARWPAFRRFSGPLLAALAALELFGASQNLPYNDLSTSDAWFGQRPAISTLLAENAGAVPPARFLSLSDTFFDPGDLREIRALYGPYLSESGLIDYVEAVKVKEILAPNLPLAWRIPTMDGFDGGILPTRDYIAFTSLFLDESAVTPDGRLRENLDSVPPLAWLRMSNVRYVITDKVYDAWVDGVYFDLQFASRANSGQHVEAYPPVPFSTNAVGIVGHLSGGDAPSAGTPIAELVIEGQDGAEVRLPIVSGQSLNTGEPVGYFTPEQPGLAEYALRLAWDAPVEVRRVTVEVLPAYNGELVIRGLTLIDERSGAFQFTTLSADNTVEMIYSADVKVYEVAGPARAFAVCAPVIASTPGDAAALLREQPEVFVVTRPDAAVTPATCLQDASGDVEIISYEPERVVVQAQAAGDGVYLFLMDAWYPGWSARIDGAPVQIHRANFFFRAVALPPGAHEVVFTYDSRLFRTGMLISVISLLGCLGGLTGIGVYRFRSRSAGIAG